MQFPASQTYRPALAIGFILCLLWLVLLSIGVFERIPIPADVKYSIALIVPLAAVIALLHRTPLFREMSHYRRFANLFGLALTLLVCAGTLLLATSLLQFAAGLISLT